MQIYTVVALTFSMIVLGLLSAVLWSAWFPTTRCQKKATKDMPLSYNICIKNRSHEGPCMAASGHEFYEGESK